VPLKTIETITVTEKVPVIVKEPVKMKAELYGGILLPFTKQTGLGAFVDVSHKGKIYGAQYQVIGDSRFVSAKIGFRF
jgi:hypothetical protein